MEVAGFVIGGVSMVAIFDSTMSAFDYIETGANYGKDYNRLAVRESLLKYRLSRWAAGVVAVNKSRKAQSMDSIGTRVEVNLVQKILESIANSIKRTEKFAKRYNLENSAPPASDTQMTSDQLVLDLEELSLRSRSLAALRQKDTSLSKKWRWALRDSKKFQSLIEHLEQSLDDLEDIFPEVKEAQKQIATVDAKELIQPSGPNPSDDEHATGPPKQPPPGHTQRPLEVQERIAKVISEATSDVDPELNAAVSEVMTLVRSGHTFESILALGKSKIAVGNSFHHGAVIQPNPPGSTNVYKSIVADEDARIRVGDTWYGPGQKSKGVFDD